MCVWPFGKISLSHQILLRPLFCFHYNRDADLLTEKGHKKLRSQKDRYQRPDSGEAGGEKEGIATRKRKQEATELMKRDPRPFFLFLFVFRAEKIISPKSTKREKGPCKIWDCRQLISWEKWVYTLPIKGAPKTNCLASQFNLIVTYGAKLSRL